MEYPLISIIVPVYKVEKYLHNCIKSVLIQSYSNWELILVNDGSPDACPQICDFYATQDSRIYVIHKQNGGLSDARNFGIKASSGEFLLFLDSDDYWDDSLFLQKLVVIISKNPNVDVINFGWKKFYPEENLFVEDSRTFSLLDHSEIMKDEFTRKMIRNDLYVACAWNKCIRSQFLKVNNIFFKKGIKSEDMGWCGDILYHLPFMICYNTKAYIYTQQRTGSITSTLDANHLLDMLAQIKDALTKGECLVEERKNIYLSFFALQYLTLLYNVNRTHLRIYKNLTTETRNLKDILCYDTNIKVKIANQIRKFVGYRLMGRAMHTYTNLKKR